MKRKTRQAVADIMNRLYAKGLTTTSGGNVSMRLKQKILITPSQTDKGNMRGEQIGVITLDGKNLTPNLKLSMETGMHQAIYKARKDVRAIVHAHPFAATALSAREGLIDSRINGEARAMLGKPAFVPYETMGTTDLAQKAAKAIVNSNAIILQHHGILTVGETLLQAFDRLELMEMTARAMVIRQIYGIEERISDDHIAIIDRMFDQP
mgnify:CR=1 FL=1